MSAALPVDAVWVLALTGVRLTALLLAAPVFSHAAVPLRVRAALALVLTVLCAPRVIEGVASPEGPPVAAFAAVAHEVVIGATLGFALRLVFAGFGLLGEFIAVQGGLGAATVLDPTSGASSVVLTSLLQFFALTVFLAIDGHHEMLRAVVHSLEWLPPGSGGLPPERFAAVGALGASLFEVAARLAAPVTVVMLASNVAVGILGRVIPQLNLMALQLPAHIAVTLLVLGLGTTGFAGAVAQTLRGLLEAAVLAVRGGG